jgi:hypothetical protein
MKSFFKITLKLIELDTNPKCHSLLKEFLEKRKEVIKEEKAALKAAKEAKLLRTAA